MPAEYCQPVPHSLAFEVIRFRIARLKDAGEKVPIRLCAASYLNDVLAKPGGAAVKKQSDYANIWGYSRSWVSRHWEEIKAEAEAQKDMYQAQRKAEKEAPQQPRNSAATAPQQARNSNTPADATDADSGDFPQQRGNSAATDAQQPNNTYRSHSSNSQNNGGGGGGAPAREEDPFGFFSERDDVHRPEIEEVVAEQQDLAEPGWLLWLARKKWGDDQAPAKAYLESRLERFSASVLVAGLVIAKADHPKGEPHTAYLESILQRLDEQKQRTQQGLPPAPPRRKRSSGGKAGGGGRPGGRGGGSAGPPGRTANRSRGALHGEGRYR